MKKFLVFMCVLFLMVGCAIPVLAVDGEDGGDIALATNDEIIPDEEPIEEEEPILYPITVSYVFWDNATSRNVVYSTTGNTQYASEGQFFCVNGYSGAMAFSATIPGYENMIWWTKSVYVNGTTNTVSAENCSGTMETCPISITFYYIPFEDTVYVDHYCDDILVETTSFIGRIGTMVYAPFNSYDGYTVVNELVGAIVPARTSGVAPLHIRMDYHSANYTPTITPEPEPPTPTPDIVETTPEPETPEITPEPVIPETTPEPEIPDGDIKSPAPTPEIAETTPVPALAVAHPAPMVAKQNAPAQSAEEATAGWSIINLLLALGCLGFGYALFNEDNKRFDGLIIGALAFVIFFMTVVSWTTLIIADKTTIILTGVLILNVINYFLRNKEPRL